MRDLKNINWETERELIVINDCTEEIYNEEDWYVSFEYNGYKIISIVDFVLNLSKYEEEETNTNEVYVDTVDVLIKQMFDEDDNPFNIPVKEEIDLQNKLAIELKIQF